MGVAYEGGRYRFTVTAYHKMVEADIFDEDDRVELIDGDVVPRAKITSRQASSAMQLNRFFILALDDRAWVTVKNPVTLGAYSQPQPILSILKPRADAYATAHPGPADVLLLIEVSDSSLAYDRERKLDLYARYGIVEVWILDVQARRIEAYRDPANGVYKSRRVYEAGDSIAPGEISGVTLAVIDIVGPEAGV